VSLRYAIQAIGLVRPVPERDTHIGQQVMASDAPVRNGLASLIRFADALPESRTTAVTVPTELSVGVVVDVAMDAGRLPVDMLDIQFRRQGMISFIEHCGAKQRMVELVFTDADGGEGEVPLKVRGSKRTFPFESTNNIFINK
jgi:hypothetical protein